MAALNYLCMYIIFLALCSSPSSPSKGGVISAGNSVGDTATYTCNTGFELIGQAEATCTLNTDGNSASFMPAQPICRRKFWPAFVIQHAINELLDYHLQHSVQALVM